ncbi:MAG: FAD-dependent oxidoreductase [Bacteroidia bacterium]
MKRADFVRLTAAALAAAPFAALTARPRSRKVLVIGAGMAGAAAAHHLRASGSEVVVIEARSRPGGRIDTCHDWGFPIERGANSIHDSRNPENPLREMARTLGVTTRPTSYFNLAVTDADNQPVGRLRVGRFYLRLLRELYRQGSALAGEADRSLQEVFDQALRTQGWDPGDRLSELAAASLMNNLAAPLSDASAQYYLSPAQPADSRDLLVTGGYVRLVEALLEGVAVQYGQVARVVRDTGSRVVVETDTDVFEGDEVIVTVPLSLLQQGAIAFEPGLPAWKTASFQSMHMGAFNKVFLALEEVFWPAGAHFLCYTEADRGAPIAVNYHHFADRPVLVAMPVAAAALEVEQMDEVALRRRWEQILRRAHPRAEIAIHKVMATAWSGDPYARGAYAHVPPGSTPQERLALAAPAGRIRFAGEATAGAYHSTVHGAWLSGVRGAGR